MLSATPARPALRRAISIAPASGSEAWIGGSSPAAFGLISANSASQRAGRTPANP